jgi:uridine phosphorylase
MPDMPEEKDARDEPLLTASKLLTWRSTRAGITLPRLPEAAVLTHQRSLLPRRLFWRRDPIAGLFSFDSRSIAGGAVTLACVRGVGAPATAGAIEELAATGVRRLIAVDIGGSIVPGLSSGAALLVDGALACDGTSPHYTADRRVRPDNALTQRLSERLQAAGIAFSTGAVVSTDAVYRETPSMLESARDQGAIAVDMETACVFAVAAATGIEAAAVLVMADELHDGWRPPADITVVQSQLRRLLDVATTCSLP